MSVERLTLLSLFCCLTFSWVNPARASEDSGDEVDPGYVEAHSLVQRKKWAEAVVTLKRIFESSPESSPNYSSTAVDLARALVYSDHREEAVTVLRQAASKQKGSKKAALVRRAQVISRIFLSNLTFQIYQEGLNFAFAKKFKLARERFEKALEKEPDNVEIITRIGQCFLLEGDFVNSTERLRLAKKYNSDEPVIRLWLGRALHHQGQFHEAIEELTVAESELTGSEVAPIWLADANFASGQRVLSVDILERDLKKFPFHVDGLLALAKFKYTIANKDVAQLWGVREDLQVATSRLEKYSSESETRSESSLGLNMRNPGETAAEIKTLQQKVEDRIQAAKNPSGV